MHSLGSFYRKRASDGLYRLLRHYIGNVTFSNALDKPSALANLPDYIFIMDDDTFMDVSKVTDYLAAQYNPNEPFVLAGCLLRYASPKVNDTFTIPWGGFGTILSRGAIQNLFRPIHCHSDESKDAFTKNACWRLSQNLMDERQFFEEGMTVADLMHAHTSQARYADHAKWPTGEAPTFCVYR